MALKHFAAGIAVTSLLAGSIPAHANTLTWSLDDVSFTSLDGTIVTATGSFTVYPSNGYPTSWDITVHGGVYNGDVFNSAQAGNTAFEDGPGTPATYTYSPEISYGFFTPNTTPLGGTTLEMGFLFADLLPATGGTIPIAARFCTSGISPACVGSSLEENGVGDLTGAYIQPLSGGFVTASVPEPGTLALLGAGLLGLAGFAAFGRRKTKTAAAIL